MSESSNAGVDVLGDGPEWLILACDLPNLAPDEVIAWFTAPDRLAQWWGDRYEIEPHSGGAYVIHFTRAERTLRGRIAELGPRRLTVSWHFDHEPDAPPCAAIIQAADGPAGSRLTIHHGPFAADNRDDEERAGIIEGWQFFLPRLQAAIAATG